jgi:hypothetical protein
MGWSDTMLYCVFYFIFQLWVEVTPCCICFLFYISAMCWSDTMLYCVFYFIFQLWVEVTPCCICFLFYFSAMCWSDTMLYLFSILFFSYVLKWYHVVLCFLFSSPGHRPCELLSWVSVRRPSVSFSHLNLLLWNRWTEISQTCQKCSLDGPLPDLCFWCWFEIQHGCQGP